MIRCIWVVDLIRWLAPDQNYLEFLPFSFLWVVDLLSSPVALLDLNVADRLGLQLIDFS
jgi:hypothetical protein